MTTSIIETAKGKIEYTLLGRGVPILIVVGGHTNCKETIFHKGLDKNKLCFITPSRPGYGLTPLTEQNNTPKGTSDLFIALLDELKIQKVIVFGISAGGLTALEIAANYPERIDNLILLSALTKKWFSKTDKVYKGAKRIFAPTMECYTWFSTDYFSDSFQMLWQRQCLRNYQNIALLNLVERSFKSSSK